MIRKLLSKINIRSDKWMNDYMLEQHYYPITHFDKKDVFIVGYPKSGNTWMQHILASLIFGISPKLMPDKLVQELIPQIYSKKYYKRFLDFTCFTSHELPRPDFKKVIYLVRDGRDAMASYYAYNQNLGVNIPIEEMIKDGKGLFPCKWNEHTKAWLKNPYNAEILFIKYENLITNPDQTLIKITDFLKIQRAESIIKTVISENKFEVMQHKEKTFGWHTKSFPKDKKFVRKGKIGNYKSEISNDLIRYFEIEAQQELEHFGYL